MNLFTGKLRRTKFCISRVPVFRLAEEVGDPALPVVMVNMTTRCGSTLLVQMMNRVPGTRAMSEGGSLHKVK